MTHLYHFTDTARLPWILRDGELRPGRAALGGFPVPDFVWATDMPIVDRTATSSINRTRMNRDQQAMVRDVRITLPAHLFRPWADAPLLAEAWTPAEMRRLERFTGGRSAPKNWFISLDPVPLALATAVETRGGRDRDWQPLAPGTVSHAVGEGLGVSIGDTVYASVQQLQKSGAMGYAVGTLPAFPTT